MHKFFYQLYQLIDKNKITAALASLVFLLACVFFASKIHFEEDINQIIPKNEKSDLTAKVLKQLNFSDKIIVIIDNQSSNKGFQLSETADAFLEKIKPLEKDYIKSVQGKVDDDEMSKTFDFVYQNIPLFLDEKDYETISQRISEDSIAKRVEDNYKSLVSPTSLVTKEFIKKDPLGISFLGLEKLKSLNIDDDFTLENNYVVSKDGNHLLLFLEPKFGGSETKNNEFLVEKLNEIKSELNQTYNGKTELSYFGSPMIAVANAHQIKTDIQSTIFISLTALLLLLIVYFRKVLTPIIIFIPTLFAVAVALLVLFITKDKISAISISVGAILLGITVDYSLHILTHFKHNHNIKTLYKDLTKPILLSSMTTAISFLCLVFVRSEALRDLGVFASISVLCSSIFALIFIPHLYQPKKSDTENKNILDKIGSYDYEKNKVLLIICGLIILLCVFGFQHVKFNQNIGDLNFVPDDMKASEAKLEKLSDITSKSIYVISYGGSEEEALSKNSKLTTLLQKEKDENKILNYNSIGQIVLSKEDQQKKINRWNAFWTPKLKQNVLSELIKNGHQFQFKTSAFDDFSRMLNQSYKPIPISDYQNLKALQLSEMMNADNGFYTVSTLVKVDESNRQNVLNDIKKSDDFLAIDRQQMNETFLGLLKDDFLTLINYSLLAIFAIILLVFRRLELALLAMLPIVLTGMVTAGLLYFFGLQLNIFSTIVCTLVFGVGVDFSIFLTQALQKEYTTGEKELPTYRVSIMLAILTTILAIGVLIFAKHPALHSVASVALIGMFSVIVITLVLYPFLFNLLITKRAKKGISPIGLRHFLMSAFAFTYYGLGGIVFSFFGQFFIPKTKGKSREQVKKIMAKFLRSVLYTNPFVEKRVINNHNEIWEKPAVIIANHTSSLDTITMALATHKIIYLVNDWVFKSPVFGKLVQTLGFYPVSQGIENGTEQLMEKVKEGYSLMIFPEATRSKDNAVKRFHKGAFYLAEQFNLDILPVYIHGNSEVLPKDDYIIYDGSITVKVGERIDKDDIAFGKDYSEKTKKINAHFREEFTKLRHEIEDENYFRKALFLSFLYKENEIIKEVKKDFGLNKTSYFNLNQHIGKNDVVLHLSKDYGQVDVLLTLQEAQRKVFSFNQNETNRKIALQNYFLKRRSIKYLNSIDEFQKEADVLLISDGSFNIDTIKTLPKKIIFLNVPSSMEKFNQYSLQFQSENITVYALNQ